MERKRIELPPLGVSPELCGTKEGSREHRHPFYFSCVVAVS
jgi:hypothetical protein